MPLAAATMRLVPVFATNPTAGFGTTTKATGTTRAPVLLAPKTVTPLVSAKTPPTTELDAVRVSVEVPVPLAMDAGLNVAEIPGGKLLALKVTIFANPAKGFTVIVLVTLLPAKTVCVHGVETVKSAEVLFVG